MAQVTQAELARIYGVSRKTVTKWKAEGRLALSGDFVDLEKTRARLAQSATSRTKRVTLSDSGKRLVLPVAAAGKGADPFPSEACSLSALIAGGAQDLAVLLLRLGLARAAVTQHVDQWLAQQRAGAVDCMAEDVPPPTGHDTWATHPLFVGPWLDGTSWTELEALAVHAQDR